MELDRVIDAARRLEEEIRAVLGAESSAAAVVDPIALLYPDSRASGAELPAHVTELLLDEAARVQAEDPALAVLLLTYAADVCMSGDDVGAGLAIVRRARRLAAGLDAETQASARLTEDTFVALTGLGPVSAGPAEPSALAEVSRLHRLTKLSIWNEDYARARTIGERAVEVARTGNRGFLPVALDTLALVDSRTGRWSAAASRSLEALRLALELGQSWQAASCATTLAWLAAATGREEDCRRRAIQALELAPASEIVFGWATAAVGFLELSLDRPQAAVDELEKIAAEPRFSTTALNALPLLVEAQLRVERFDDARQTLERLEQQARATRQAGTLALAARCRGLLADPGAYALHFEEALELHLRLPTPFERARTTLLFGERLRRGRRRAEARPLLQAALGAFERLGAVKWAERARRELDALRRRRPAPGGLEAQLTARELQVAELVGRGATNREAASALSVSSKTIEYHLRSIYGKLGIRSRTELARLLI